MRPPSGKVGITSSLRGSVATVAIPKIGVRVKIYRHSEPLAKNLPEGWFSVCIKTYSRNFYFSKVLQVRRSLFSVVFVGGVGGLFAVFRSGDFLRNVLHKVSNRHYYADNREHRDEPLPKYG